MAAPGTPEDAGTPSPVPGPSSLPARADLGPRVLAGAGFALFGLVAIDRVGEGPLTDLDAPLLGAIPHDGPLHTVSALATHLGDQPVLAAIALLGAVILLRDREFIDAGVLVLAKAASVTVVYGLKFLFNRLRPATGPEGAVCCAFPSGHATETAMVFMLLAVLLFEREGWVRSWAEGVAIGLALVVGATRVILAVHWPTDVLAGWGLGWGLAGAFLLLRALMHRKAGTWWAMPAADARAAPRAEVQANARVQDPAAGSRGCQARDRRVAGEPQRGVKRSLTSPLEKA